MNMRENCGGFRNWLTDDKCFLVPHSYFVKTAMMVLGYLSYDFYVQWVFVKDTSALATQMIWHHIIGSTCIFTGSMCGYAMPGIENCMILVETSTFFINTRSMYDKKDFNLLIPQICQVLFFFSFTILRVIGMPWSVYLMLKDMDMVWPHLSDLRKWLLVGTIVQYIGIYFLNLYWYKLIIKGVMKLMGFDSKKDKKVTEILDEKLHNY